MTFSVNISALSRYLLGNFTINPFCRIMKLDFNILFLRTCQVANIDTKVVASYDLNFLKHEIFIISNTIHDIFFFLFIELMYEFFRTVRNKLSEIYDTYSKARVRCAH